MRSLRRVARTLARLALQAGRRRFISVPWRGPREHAATSWHALRWLERGLFVIGLLLVGCWLKDFREAYAFQSVTSRGLEAALRQPPQPGTPSQPSAIDAALLGADPEGSLGRIEIPRLRISAMIAEGTGAEALRRAVGHVASSAHPGSPGNVALAGHRDTFFRGLGGIHEGDLVRIVTAESTYAYRVEWTAIVDPGSIEVLDSTAAPSLTLVTCYPFHWVGPAPRRFVVRAASTADSVPDAP